MRHHGDDFFGAVVEVAKAGLAAGEQGFAGEGVWVCGKVGGFVWVEGVDGGEVEGGEFGGDDGDGGACVAGFVGIFWSG